MIHLSGEQPVIADLYAMPGPGDVLLHCTNLRNTNGKRPVFVDRQDSDFFFPMTHIRFIEVVAAGPPPGAAAAVPAVAGASDAPLDDEEIEIDEDFLRRIREV